MKSNNSSTMYSSSKSKRFSSATHFSKFSKSMLTMFPPAGSAFSLYFSITTQLMLFRTLFNDLIPYPLRKHISSALNYLFRFCSGKQTVVIEQSDGIEPNQVFNASEVYLSTKISPDSRRLKLSKRSKDKDMALRLDKGQRITDSFQGIELKWRHVCYELEKKSSGSYRYDSNAVEKRYFELSFKKKYGEIVLNSYLPFVLKTAEMIESEVRVLKMHTLGNSHYSSKFRWESVKLEHPSTFETLALDTELKNMIMEDLSRFLRRKEFYKRVGRSWKRGYLLYGPPGTGKSSLIAAMANYLKFDIYDLQLENIKTDSELRKLLLDIANKSILVIEDIDCTVNLPDRQREKGSSHKRSGQDRQLTLSGLLNFIDGLWSSCGDERIIVLTTNHKHKLDPALLRPGRMDMHINMSYCTSQAFRILASNYLEIKGEHRLFSDIDPLLESSKVSPAQVAEELMKNEDPDIALQGFFNFLKNKKIEDNELEGDVSKHVETKESDGPKIEHKKEIKKEIKKESTPCKCNAA